MIITVKQPDRETEHQLTSSVDIYNVWNLESTTPILLRGMMLGENVIFIFILQKNFVN
jgi:hypothetical protein